MRRALLHGADLASEAADAPPPCPPVGCRWPGWQAAEDFMSQLAEDPRG